MTTDAWSVDLGGLVPEYGLWWFVEKSEAYKFRSLMANEYGTDTTSIKVSNRSPSASGAHVTGTMAPPDHPSLRLEGGDGCNCQQFTVAFFKSAEEAEECQDKVWW